MGGIKKNKKPGDAKEGKETKDSQENDVEDEASSSELTTEESELTTAKAILSLSNNIAEMKDELKQELASLKSDMNQKLQNLTADVRNQGTRLTEAEQRVSELETMNADLRGALRHCLAQQKTLQTKMTDFEGRSRRNNIRIYGIREGAEKNDIVAFITQFLRSEFSLGDDVKLQIQRVHRSLAPTPGEGKPARSILVNFQRFDIKEKIIKMAWAKKIMIDGKVVTFANDMPTEVYNKLKEYKDIKKTLKEAKIRFQTPYPARMRIYWEDGPRLYSNATEVAGEMKRRGYSTEEPRVDAEEDWDRILMRDAHWERINGRSERLRERLRGFQREQV